MNGFVVIGKNFFFNFNFLNYKFIQSLINEESSATESRTFIKIKHRSS